MARLLMKPNPGLVALLMCFFAGTTPAQEPNPDSIAGLVARYESRTLHGHLANDGKVEAWNDSSGNGHDLTYGGKGLRGLFRTRRANGKPVVELQKRGFYLVREPFELDDHTIFIVSRTGGGDRALLRSDTKSSRGIVLYAKRRQHLLRTGGVGAWAAPYTSRAEPSGEFDVTVLAREAGRLRAYVNGIEVSSGEHLAEPLRVGAFFQIVYSQHVDKDAQGLEIAEMLFYERFLSRKERESVTARLTSTYGLEERMSEEASLKSRLAEIRNAEGAELVWLGTESVTDLNRFDDVAAVPWTVRERVDAPFENRPGELSTRIGCKRDGTLIRIHLSLELEAANPGSSVRVLLLRNGADYLEDDAVSGAFGGDGEAGRATVELETTVFLDAGDWVEVIGEGYGAEGEVRVVPGRALFVAESR
jgi:hypothetical protein